MYNSLVSSSSPLAVRHPPFNLCAFTEIRIPSIRNMHMDTDPIFIGMYFGLDNQLVRIIENGAQSEPDANPTVRSLLPSLLYSRA
jgi:hypothetical protein